MERRDGWLGYVAIGLGVLALVVALTGRPGRSSVSFQVPYAQPVAPAAPAAPVIPEELRRGRSMPEGRFHREHEQRWFDRGPGPDFHIAPAFGWGGHHHGPFGIFGMIGHLARLGLVLLLLLLGLKLLRDWRGPGNSGGGGNPPPTAPPSELGGPEPPTTGPTVYL